MMADIDIHGRLPEGVCPLCDVKDGHTNDCWNSGKDGEPDE